LQLAKPGVDFAWGFISKKPVDGNHEM